MKYKDDKSMQFLKGNAAQLFKSFMTEMDPHATPRDLEKLMQAAKPQVVGPEVKNSYTIQFVEIVKALLVNTPIPVFDEKKGKLQITGLLCTSKLFSVKISSHLHDVVVIYVPKPWYSGLNI